MFIKFHFIDLELPDEIRPEVVGNRHSFFILIASLVHMNHGFEVIDL